MSEKNINASGGFGAPEENLKEKEIRASLEAAGMLVPEEQDLADALLDIVDKHGKFNADNTGVWAGYTSAKENAENAEIGVKCGNCVFWQAPNGCQIIVAETEEGGLCRFAVLPDGSVTPDLYDSSEEGNKEPVEKYFSKEPKLVQDLLKSAIKEADDEYSEEYLEIYDLIPTQETVDSSNFKEAVDYEKPVVVYKDDSGMYLVDGHHRCATKVRDGASGVKAKVYKQLSLTSSADSEANLEKNVNDPCWDGYVQVGMKKGKDGNMVPNCVPIDNSTVYLKTLDKASLANKSEEEIADVLAELSLLDSKEFNVIKNTVTLKRNSLEYRHNEVRLNSLVASGTVSTLLADIASTLTENDFSEEYFMSRQEFLFEVDANTNEGYNPYDLGGKLTRLVDRHSSKAEITEFLDKNTFFKSQKELLNYGEDYDSLDVETKVSIYKIRNLLEALDNIQDPEVPINFAAIAKEKVSKYDLDGSIGILIDSGADSKEIFEALKGNSEFESDAYDYLTRDDVDLPQDYQKASWGEFSEIVFSIKDLDPI
jgi:hypothetical protein